LVVERTMAFVDKSAPGLALPSDLEFFEKKNTDLTVQHTYIEKHSPISQYDPGQGDIEFQMSADTQDYMKPDEFCITFEAEIRRVAGNAALTAADRVAFENNAAHTIFKEMHVTLGDQTVVSDTFYNYTAYRKALMNYSPDANNSHRTGALFFKDSAGRMDTTYQTEALIDAATDAAAATYITNHPMNPVAEPAPEAAGYEAWRRTNYFRHARAVKHGRKRAGEALNHGLQKRFKYTEESRRVWMRMYPESDFFKINKFIPNGLSLKIKLTRAKPEFSLHAHQAEAAGDVIPYKILIHNPTLWVTKSKIRPEVYNGQNQRLEEIPATYFVTHDVTKPITVPIGTAMFVMENVTVGQLPKRIFFTFVNQDGFNGDYGRCPYNFAHANLVRAAVYIHGVSYPATPFTPRYTGNNPEYGREYDALFTALGINHGNRGIEITRDDFPNGYCIYAQDLTPNMSAADDSVLTLKKMGNPRIEVQFEPATTEAMVCIVWTESDHFIKTNSTRNVITSYMST
jgi:hypothetical protein